MHVESRKRVAGPFLVMNAICVIKLLSSESFGPQGKDSSPTLPPLSLSVGATAEELYEIVQ